MKLLTSLLFLSLGAFANDAKAEAMVTVEGKEYKLSTLMENCKRITAAETQIACFNALSQLLEKQSAGGTENSESVSQALENFRAVAQYLDRDSGLSITGTNCSIQVVYFNNYFHISRRNVSTIDVYSADFDASQLHYDQTMQAQGAPALLTKGVMDAGAVATMTGGLGLESNEHKFAPKSARTEIHAYANEVVTQLPVTESQTFDFVLVHPARSQESDQIWSAFETFVDACHQ